MGSVAMPMLTVLPPGPIDDSLHFDRHAHVHRAHAIHTTSNAPERAKILEEEDAPEFTSTRLSWQDIGSMSNRGRKTHRKFSRHHELPGYVFDAARTRATILCYLEARFYLEYGTGKLADTERIARINATAAHRSKGSAKLLDAMLDRQGQVLDREIQNIDSRVGLERRNLPGLIARVIYLRYHLGYTSPQIHAETGIRPPAVREILYRLNRTWLRIQAGYPGRHRRVLDRAPRSRRGPRSWHVKRLEKLWWLRARGKNWRACADAFGLSYGLSVRLSFFRWFQSDPFPGRPK